MKKIIYSAALFVALSIPLAACSDKEMAYTPQEIIDMALQDTEQVTTYYGEYTSDFGDDEVLTTIEYVQDGKRRIELKGNYGVHFITVNDGTMMKMLDVTNNEAMIFDLPEEDVEQLTQRSLKEQAEQMLSLIEDTHDISLAGEEQIAGRDTYHIIAKVKASASDKLVGDLEVWVDKKTWHMLKMVTSSGDQVITTQYSKIDYKPTIDAKQFVLDIPSDAKIEFIDTSSMMQPATIEEAVLALGEFYLVPDQNGLSMVKVIDMTFEGHTEFVFEYAINNMPAFSIGVLNNNSSEVEIDGLEKVELDIKGMDAYVMDYGINIISMTNGNMKYSVIIDNPDLTIDDVVAYLNTMELVK